MLALPILLYPSLHWDKVKGGYQEGCPITVCERLLFVHLSVAFRTAKVVVVQYNVLKLGEFNLLVTKP